MAVIWSLLTVNGSIVLEYGPTGTTHYSMGMLNDIGVEPNGNLYSTHMSEDDVVMGDVARLERSIIELDEGRPSVIFIVASTLSETIGADIKGVCAYMREKVNARLIPVCEGVFGGDFSEGLASVWAMLARELVPPTNEKRERTYNIVGASAGAYRVRSDVTEIDDLMAKAFGAKRICAIGFDGSVDDHKAAGEASVNIVLRGEAVRAAQTLRESTGTPYVYAAPYGYAGTSEWLKSIAEATGWQPNRAFIGTIMAKFGEAQMMRRYAAMYETKPVAAVIGEYDTVAGVAAFFGSIGFKAETLICSHSLKHIPVPLESIKHYETERQRLNELQKLHNTLVLGDDVSLAVCADDNYKVCLSFPNIYHHQLATHMPFMGVRGADFLLETAYNSLDIFDK